MLKKCFPFLDAFTSGYMITLPYDIYVKNNNGLIELSLEDGSQYSVSTREIEHESLVPFNHYPIEFFWDLYASIRIPNGASIMFTHPLNRYDLPFTTLSAVIDGELTMVPHGSIPFYIKNGFEGIIKSGTPIAQIIPFKQESWESNIEIGLCDYATQYHRSKPKDWYKRNSWKKKKYE
jgi:hypothetical protein